MINPEDTYCRCVMYLRGGEPWLAVAATNRLAAENPKVAIEVVKRIKQETGGTRK